MRASAPPSLYTSLLLRSIISVVGGPDFLPDEDFAHLGTGDIVGYGAGGRNETIGGSDFKRRTLWYPIQPDLAHGVIKQAYP